MLQKDFAPYEPSLALKELGFDEPCLAFWDAYNGDTHLLFKQRIEYHWLLRLFGKKPEPVLEISNGEIEYLEGDGAILAPTFSQAFRWFRKKYDWQHSIEPTADQHSHQLGYNYWIWNYKTGEEYHTMPKNRPSGDWEYKSYEEAELACLIKLIQIVKEKK